MTALSGSRYRSANPWFGYLFHDHRRTGQEVWERRNQIRNRTKDKALIALMDWQDENKQRAAAENYEAWQRREVELQKIRASSGLWAIRPVTAPSAQTPSFSDRAKSQREQNLSRRRRYQHTRKGK